MKKILIIEDDTNLGTTVASVLQLKGYQVKYLSSGRNFQTEIDEFDPDLIVLDVMLNEQLDGFDHAKELRIRSQVPVLFSTSRDTSEDYETGLGISNSDYVRKPYNMMEMIIRIERMLEERVETKGYNLGHFTFIPNERALKYAYENITLNHYESEVLRRLCAQKGEFITRHQLIKKVWNVTEPKIKEGSLNNIISSLRKYLQAEENIEVESRVGLGIRLVIKKE